MLHTHARPLDRFSEAGPRAAFSHPPSYFGRCMGNIKIGQLNGRLVGGREADEEGDTGDGDCGRQRSRGWRRERRERAGGRARGAERPRERPGRAGAERRAPERVRVRLSALCHVYMCVAVVRVRSFARVAR